MNENVVISLRERPWLSLGYTNNSKWSWTLQVQYTILQHTIYKGYLLFFFSLLCTLFSSGGRIHLFHGEAIPCVAVGLLSPAICLTTAQARAHGLGLILANENTLSPVTVIGAGLGI